MTCSVPTTHRWMHSHPFYVLKIRADAEAQGLRRCATCVQCLEDKASSDTSQNTFDATYLPPFMEIKKQHTQVVNHSISLYFS